MQIISIAASHGRTVKAGDGEKRYEVQLRGELAAGEDAEAARVALCQQARAAVEGWIAYDLAGEPAEAVAPAAPVVPSQRGLSEFQRGKLDELMAELHPAGGPTLDELFEAAFGHGLAAASYDEGRQMLEKALRRLRTKREAAQQGAAPAPEAGPLTREAAEQLAREQVQGILDQVRETVARATSRATAPTLTALYGAIREAEWPEPATEMPRLAAVLVGRAPSAKRPITEGEARAMTAWLTAEASQPLMDVLWPVQPVEEVPA